MISATSCVCVIPYLNSLSLPFFAVWIMQCGLCGMNNAMYAMGPENTTVEMIES